MVSSTPTELLLTNLERACTLAGVLWRLHLIGRAATVARFKYREHESVGDG